MRLIERSWQRRGPIACTLWPVSLLFGVLAGLRRLAFRRGWSQVVVSPAMTIVVGNITVGGSGKSPLTAWLAERFTEAGLSVGIVSRGHGRESEDALHMVDPTEDRAEQVGDEPLMLAQETGVPVCVGPRRAEAVSRLVQERGVEVVLADDGLQHYAMGRDVEIAVIDVTRGLGNGWLLPAGPLRERPSRLVDVDMVVLNGLADPENASSSNGIRTWVNDAAGQTVGTRRDVAAFSLHTRIARPVNRRATRSAGQSSSRSTDRSTDRSPDRSPDGSPDRSPHRTGNRTVDRTASATSIPAGSSEDVGSITLESLAGQRVHAVAGIGNPARFFDALRARDIRVIEHSMPDHHRYVPADLMFEEACPILVTSKDAVKIRSLESLPDELFEVPAELVPDDRLMAFVDTLIDRARTRATGNSSDVGVDVLQRSSSRACGERV